MHSAPVFIGTEASLGCCWVDVMIDDEVVFNLSF